MAATCCRRSEWHTDAWECGLTKVENPLSPATMCHVGKKQKKKKEEKTYFAIYFKKSSNAQLDARQYWNFVNLQAVTEWLYFRVDLCEVKLISCWPACAALTWPVNIAPMVDILINQSARLLLLSLCQYLVHLHPKRTQAHSWIHFMIIFVFPFAILVALKIKKQKPIYIGIANQCT